MCSISLCQENDTVEDQEVEPDMFRAGGPRLRANGKNQVRDAKDGSRVIKIFQTLRQIIQIFTSCFRSSQSDL